MSKKAFSKSAISEPSRNIPDWVKICLFVRAGGRCEFDGCNAYLLEHHVTLTEGNFAQLAHVVAFSEQGPRGKENRPSDINDIGNLMLLCHKCHKLIDDNPDQYSRMTLEGYKKGHEERIHHVTGLGPEQKTSILHVKSRIGDQTVEVPFDQILQAITPRYPLSKEGMLIDLTQIPTGSSAFINAACDTIQEQLRELLGASREVKRSKHISLFALAPIPVLIYLGSQLSNKVPLDLYQRHRDTENWTWKTSGDPAQYVFQKRQNGTKSGGVALLLSLSGTIDNVTLPTEIIAEYSVYELTLGNVTPNPTFLRTRQDLDEFRNQYQLAIATIVREHPGISQVDLFPAVPAPIGVLCGRELLPKVHPSVRVYDNDKHKGGFVYQLTINN
ncbi:MAG: SAVED domain-containing protein [Candidatus Paceibacterota bacterium]|jgi:hypothetical protein